MTPKLTTAWHCTHCGKQQRGPRYWCIVYGPISRKKPKPKREPVCAACKKLLGVYV